MKNIFSAIYMITSPTNQVYIGQTINYERRLQDYCRMHCKNQRKLFNSFKKYGVSAHKFEILENFGSVVNFKILNEREIYWENRYKLLKYDLLNIRACGSNGSQAKQTKEKISNTKKGKLIGVENHMYGKKHSEITINKIKESKKGYIFSSEHKKNLSKSQIGSKNHNFGKKFSDEHKEKIGIKMKKVWELRKSKFF